MPQRSPNVGLQIGHEIPEATTEAVIKAIANSLPRAIELGRTEIGVALAEALGKFGTVNNVSVAHNTIRVGD